MKARTWYTNRLNKYVEEKYAQYEESIQWFVDPSPNQWKMFIPELDVFVTMTCDDKGNVTEERVEKK